jgi:hypothetical protein
MDGPVDVVPCLWSLYRNCETDRTCGSAVPRCDLRYCCSLRSKRRSIPFPIRRGFVQRPKAMARFVGKWHIEVDDGRAILYLLATSARGDASATCVLQRPALGCACVPFRGWFSDTCPGRRLRASSQTEVSGPGRCPAANSSARGRVPGSPSPRLQR